MSRARRGWIVFALVGATALVAVLATGIFASNPAATQGTVPTCGLPLHAPLELVGTGERASPEAARTTAGALRYAPLDPARAGIGGLTLRVVHAVAGAPVPGAHVTLHGTGHAGERLDLTVASDDAGRVALRDVPAGPWLTLQVAAPGLPVVVRADVDVDAGAVRELGDVRVGHVHGLEVQVQDARARPVVGAGVRAQPIADDLVERQTGADVGSRMVRLPAVLGADVRTDAEGRARLEGLGAGTWLVTASTPGRAAARTVIRVSGEGAPAPVGLILHEAEVLPPGGRDVSFADPTEPTDGRGIAHLEGLAVGSHLVTARSPGAASARAVVKVLPHVGPAPLRLVLQDGAVLEGTVVDVRGAPVRGARVTLHASLPGERRVDVDLPRWSDTSYTGAFAIAYPADMRPSGVALAGDGFPHFAVALDGTRGDVRIVVPDGVPLDVLARDAQSGKALSDAYVEVVIEPTAIDGQPPVLRERETRWKMETRTRWDGATSLPIPPGRIEMLKVWAPGYAVGHGPIRGEPPTYECAFVRLDVPDRVTLGVPVRAEAALPRAGMYSISGRVVDAGGRGVAGVALWNRPGHGRLDPQQRAISSADGTFHILDMDGYQEGPPEELPPCSARAAGWREDLAKVPLVPDAEEPGGRTCTVVVQLAATLRGRVEDEAGLPVPGASIQLLPWPTRDGNMATSDASGQFVMTGLPPLSSQPIAEGAVLGFWNPSLAVKRAGFLRVQVPLDRVPEGQTTDVGTVTLHRARSLRGTVRGADGRAASGVLVVVRERDGGMTEFHRARTDAEGRFDVADLQGEECSVMAEPRHALERSTWVRAVHGASGTPDVQLRFERAGALDGVAIDEQGRARAFACIALLRGPWDPERPPEFLAAARTDREGRFTLAHLPLGAAVLVAQDVDAWGAGEPMYWAEETVEVAAESAGPRRLLLRVVPHPTDEQRALLLDRKEIWVDAHDDVARGHPASHERLPGR